MILQLSRVLKFNNLEVFVKRLIPDDKYPVRDCENFEFLIQTQLS